VRVQTLTHRFRPEHHGLLVSHPLANVDFLGESIAETGLSRRDRLV
jgi:hypothetical protein